MGTDAASAIAAQATASKPTPTDGTRAHVVTVLIGNETIGGWVDYEIQSSMVQPANGFTLTRPFDLDAWQLCETDMRIRVAIDGVIKLDGFIDDRTRNAKAGTIAIAGRDRAGRLVQESIPSVSGYDGLQLTDAIKKLSAPWFTTISLSDARNRDVARGKGHRAAAGNEPAFFKVKGKLDEDHAGQMDPGETRWNVIQQLCSSVGVLCWSSADGRELVVGAPNYNQQLQFLLRHSLTRGSTVQDFVLKESVGDGYAMIECNCAGVGTDSDFGDNVTSFFGVAKDGGNADGTGGDFIFPKRLVVTTHGQLSNAEAQKEAERQMTRRKFNRRQLTVGATEHGQVVAGTTRTLFTPNTMARVVDDELGLDEAWLIYSCRYRAARQGGETTELLLVPRGTAFVS